MTILIGNTAVAAVMASAAFVITRIWRNPHLAHGLWVLVLLKLVIPPMAGVPVPRLSQFQNAGDNRQVATVVPLSQTPATPTTRLVERSVSSWLLLGWGIGFSLWAAATSRRILLFRRLLKTTGPTKISAKSLAEQMGLRRVPEVRQVKARISPMLWPWKPVIILPSSLIESMDKRQLDTILAHELAHLRRRDHWVRLLELVVSGIYWWNPLVWLARRALHTAEEACCDIEVLRLLPDAGIYGDALLRASEFTASGRVPAPALGFAHPVKRRVEMILSGRVVRSSTLIRFAVLSLALVVLPWTAVWAVDEEGSSLEQRVARIEKLLERLIATQGEKSLPEAIEEAHQALGQEPSGATPNSTQDPFGGQRGSNNPFGADPFGASRSPQDPASDEVDATPGSTKDPFGYDDSLVGKPNDGKTVYMPVLTPSGVKHVPVTAEGDGTISNPYAFRRANENSVRQMKDSAETNVDSMIQAIKQKQADIKRLESEIQQLRNALAPETTETSKAKPVLPGEVIARPRAPNKR